ncbi:MAG: choice-of-anchor D domain-containing protein, partial [Chthoniobacteraceae bacterium]
ITISVLSGTNAADFSLINTPGIIAPGGESTFDVSFHPAAAGARLAKLSLRNNDANEALFDFVLGGRGIAPPGTLGIEPATLDLSVAAGATLDTGFDIANAGSGSLTFSIASSLDHYSARDSDSFGGPSYQWIDISSTGTEITNWTNIDDAATGEIRLGFAFPFYGTNIEIVRIATNGFLATRDNITFGQNGPLPNSSAPANMIAPFWSDLIIDTGGHVFWQNVGGKFIVHYDSVSLLGDPSSRVTCEAIFTPSGEITFQYKTLANVSGNCTVGIQNGRCDDAVLIAYNQPYLHPGLAVRIAPPHSASWLTVSADTSLVAPGTSLHQAVKIDTTGLAPGRYHADLTIKSNAATSATAVVPVNLTVTP